MKKPLLAAGAMCLSLASAAAAETPAGFKLELRGHVPVICRVSLEAQPAREAGLQSLGAMSEFCNAARGYQVWVDHAADVDGAIYVDGQKIALSKTGSTLISQSPTAARRSRDLQLELASAEASPATLSLRVTPL